MRLKLALLALALTALGIGIPYYLDSRIPRATAVVQIHLPFPNPEMIGEGNSGTLITGPASYRENYFETIVDPETLRSALNQLQSDQGENTIITQSDIETLRNKIQAKPHRGTDFIEITVRHESREDAIRFANAAAQAFAERVNQAERRRAERALEALDEEVQAQEVVVEKHRKGLAHRIQAFGIPYFEDDQDNPLGLTESQMLEKARKKLEAFKSARDQTEIQIKKLGSLKDNDLILYAAGLDLPENQVASYHAQYQKALTEKLTLSGEGPSPNDKKLVAIDQQIRQMEGIIQDEITTLRTNLQTKLDLVSRQIKRMEEMLDNKYRPNLDSPSGLNRYHNAKEVYEQSREMLREMKLRQEEARILFENIRDTVTIHQLAQ